MPRLVIIVGLAGLLAGCEPGGPAAPAALSEGEAQALDAAAAMLDERRLPPEAIPPEVAQPATLDPAGAEPAVRP